MVHLWLSQKGSSKQVLKNKLIYNFMELASNITKSCTHPHIFKLPIMPEMDNIQPLSWSFSHGQYRLVTIKSSREKCTIQIFRGWSYSLYLNTCSKCPSNFEIDAIANSSRRAFR